MAFFGPQYKLHIHTLQVILIHIIMGLTVPRIFMKNQPRTRATTIALGMVSLSLPNILHPHSLQACPPTSSPIADALFPQNSQLSP